MVKFASFEVLSVEVGPGVNRAQRRVIAKNLGTKQTTATFKQAHRHEFEYTPRPGYLYVRSRAISSRCNDNFDEFPAEEIKKAYRSFIGKPTFVNHHNENHRRARGVIIDAALHEDVNPDGTPDTWVEVLHEVDAVRFPLLAKAIIAGHIDRTSMGTDVAFSLCSFCGNKAEMPLDYCAHIPRLKGKKIRRTTASGEKTDVLVREICHGLRFFENSLLVEEPADPTAYFLGVDASALSTTAKAKGEPVSKSETEDPSRYDGVSIRQDDDGYFVHTHRARSKSYPSPEAIPKDKIDFIESTGIKRAAALIRQAEFDEDRAKREPGGKFTKGPDTPLKGPKQPGQEDPKQEDQSQQSQQPAADGERPAPPEADQPGGKNNPIKAQNVEEAAQALSEGKWVQLNQPREVSTLLDKLSQLTQQAKAAGENAPSFDLCQVTVPGTNLFCTESKGIARIKMPQLKAKNVQPGSRAAEMARNNGGEVDLSQAFRESLESRGIAVEDASEQASYLRASQNELNGSKVAGITQGLEAGTVPDEPIFVSKDNYIVDGHHRWAAKVGHDLADGTLGDVEMPVQRIDMDIIELLREANNFAAEWGIPPQGVSENQAEPAKAAALIAQAITMEAIAPAVLPIVTRVAPMLAPSVLNGGGDKEEEAEQKPKRDYNQPLGADTAPNPYSARRTATEQHDPQVRSEYVGKCADCNGQFCWSNDNNTKGVRSHTTDTRFRCPNINCSGTVQQTTRRDTGGGFTHLEDSQVTSLQRFAYGETLAPAKVDTMRQEHCPVCKEPDSFDGDRCQVCGYNQPPDEFTDPDTEVAKAVDLRQDQGDDITAEGDGALECDNCAHTFASDEQTGDVDEDGTEIPETEDPASKEKAPDEYDDPNSKLKPEDQPDNEIKEKKQPVTPPINEVGDPKVKTDDQNAAKPDSDPNTDPAKAQPGTPLPEKSQTKPGGPVEAPQTPKQEVEDGTSTGPQVGDKCPDCGEGTLQAKAPQGETNKGFPPKDESEDPDKADEEERPEGEDGKEPPVKDKSKPESDDEDDEDEDEKKKKGENPFAKKSSGASVGAQSPIEGRDVDMARPALAALAEQQGIIERQSSRIAALEGGFAFIAELAGVKEHPKVAALLKQADEANPAQPVPEPAPEAPAAPTDEARAPEGTDNVESTGETPVNDTAPDATVSVDDGNSGDCQKDSGVANPGSTTGGRKVAEETVLDEPLDLNEQDPTKPVDGATGPRPETETKIETDVRVGEGDNTSTMNPWTIEGGRTFAALRLARLRVSAGIANGDDIALAQQIEASKVSDETIQNEINVLSQVTQASKAAPVARNLVPQSAGKVARTTPSMGADNAPLTTQASMAYGPSDDEFGFE